MMYSVKLIVFDKHTEQRFSRTMFGVLWDTFAFGWKARGLLGKEFTCRMASDQDTTVQLWVDGTMVGVVEYDVHDPEAGESEQDQFNLATT